MEEAEVAQEGVTGVRRPMNAFLIFCKRHRSLVRQKNPHLDNRSVTRVLGELWANLPVEEKSSYTSLAKQYKEAFLKANPDYKWYNPEKVTSPGGNKPSTRPTNSMTTYHGHKPHVQNSATSPVLKIPGPVGGLNLLLAAGQHALQGTDAQGQIFTIPQAQPHLQAQTAMFQGQMPLSGAVPTAVTTTVPVTFHADTRDMVLNLSKSVVASLPLTSPVKLEPQEYKPDMHTDVKFETNNNSEVVDMKTPKTPGVFMFLPPGCVTSSVSLGGLTSLAQTVIPSQPINAALVSNSVATLATTNVVTSTQHSNVVNPATIQAESMANQYATMTVGNFIKQEIARATNEINSTPVALAPQGEINLSQALSQVNVAGTMPSWVLAQPPGVVTPVLQPAIDGEKTDKNTALLELAQMCSTELSTSGPQKTVPVSTQPALATAGVPVSHENFPLTPPWTPKYDSTFSPRHDCAPPDISGQSMGWPINFADVRAQPKAQPVVACVESTGSSGIAQVVEKEAPPARPNPRPPEIQIPKAAATCVDNKKLLTETLTMPLQPKVENSTVPQKNLSSQTKKADLSRSPLGGKKPLLEKAEVSKLVVERVIESMYSLEFGKPQTPPMETKEAKVSRSLIGGTVRSAAARKEMPATMLPPGGRPLELSVPPSGVTGGNGRSKSGLTFGQIQETLIRKAVADAYDFDLEEEKLKQEKEISPKLTPIKRDKDGSPRASRNGSPNEDKPKSKVISLMGIKTTKLDFHQPEVPQVLSPVKLQPASLIPDSGSKSPARNDAGGTNTVLTSKSKPEMKSEVTVNPPEDTAPVIKKKKKKLAKNKESKEGKKSKQVDSPKKPEKEAKISKKKVKKEGEKKKLKKKTPKGEGKTLKGKDAALVNPSPDHVDQEVIDEQGDTEDECGANMRKSKRSNRGKRYQQLIEEGFLQPARDKQGAKKGENYLQSDRPMVGCRKRTMSEMSEDSPPKKFKTGDFDLEAHIASLPACHIDGVDRKAIRQRMHKVRHHSDSSVLSRNSLSASLHQLNVAELHQVLKQKCDDPPAAIEQTAPLVGSQRRKARKGSIRHLHPVDILPPQDENKDMSNTPSCNSADCPQSAPPIPSLTACVSLAALADVAGNNPRSEACPSEAHPPTSSPVTVSC